MNLFSLLKFITAHPLNRKNKFQAILRFLKWQFGSRLMPYPIIYSFTDRSKLIIKKGMTGATGNFYCGLHEFNDMGFLIHLLRKEDFFVDIGANVGSYTVLAGGHIGAKTFSIEPVPATYSHLVNNILLNQMEDRVTAFNIALGSQPGSINFTHSFDTMNHAAAEGETDIIKVPVDTLDNILVGQKTPVLLKIDVEGFETEVNNGATQTLQRNELKAIIIELNGSGSRYGYDESIIHDGLIKMGFSAFLYDPLSRTLTKVNEFGTHNTIYIRDLEFVQQRLKTAPKLKIFNTEM